MLRMCKGILLLILGRLDAESCHNPQHRTLLFILGSYFSFFSLFLKKNRFLNQAPDLAPLFLFISISVHSVLFEIVSPIKSCLFFQGAFYPPFVLTKMFGNILWPLIINILLWIKNSLNLCGVVLNLFNFVNIKKKKFY